MSTDVADSMHALCKCTGLNTKPTSVCVHKVTGFRTEAEVPNKANCSTCYSQWKRERLSSISSMPCKTLKENRRQVWPRVEDNMPLLCRQYLYMNDVTASKSDLSCSKWMTTIITMSWQLIQTSGICIWREAGQSHSTKTLAWHNIVYEQLVDNSFLK